MEVKELKLLLKLIGKPNYHGTIRELKPNQKTKLTETEKICRRLCDRNLVTCDEEVIKIKLTSVGKALLKLKHNQLPITADEFKLIKACKLGTISIQEAAITPAHYRQQLIDSLMQKGLITAAATKIKQVELTEQGKDFLLYKYNPQGHTNSLSLNLLNNYLVFLRNFFLSPHLNTAHQSLKPHQAITNHKLADQDILQTIIDLDQELGTENYLPIFYLREKLQPPLSRTELDAALYRLQKQEQLEFSSLVVAKNYSQSQINAGIPQTVGGRLFFLIVNR